MSILEYLCHQQRDRCFYFKGKNMPLCSRCFGFYLFFALSLLLTVLAEILHGLIGDVRPIVMALIFGITLLPMLADGLLQYRTRYESTNTRRFLTGMISGAGFGTAVAWFLFMVVR